MADRPSAGGGGRFHLPDRSVDRELPEPGPQPGSRRVIGRVYGPVGLLDSGSAGRRDDSGPMEAEVRRPGRSRAWPQGSHALVPRFPSRAWGRRSPRLPGKGHRTTSEAEPLTARGPFRTVAAAPRQLAAIMFTDVVGFTELGQRDEPGALHLLDELEAISGPVLQRHHGRKVKAMGDGLLVEFPDALDAVQCAVDLQGILHERNAAEGVRPLRLRVGLHLGDVQRRGEDIVGDAVNIASRVEPLAEPGGVCLSEHVAVQVRNRVPYRLERLGARSLKGVRDQIDIYRVVLPWMAEPVDAAREGPPRLAVLPLTNISPDAKDEYIADGLTEELISVLSRLRGLRVIARTSVSQYKAGLKSIRQVGTELGVGSVLEGSVRRFGDRLRITLQLVDSTTEEHRWAETFDREFRDIFEIQAEVAERTARALRVELLGADHAALRRLPTQSLDAYEFYLRGVVVFQRTADEGWTRAGVEEALDLLNQAIAIDPSFAEAHAALANLLIAGMGESFPMVEVADKARTVVDTALRLDPQNAEVHTARGNYALQFERDWPRAETEFQTAIALNPSSMAAHAWYGILLISLGRYAEAIRETEAAMRLDPLFRNALFWRCRASEYAGDVDDAVRRLEALRNRDPSDRALRVRLAELYLKEGRTAEARQEISMAGGPLTGTVTSVTRAAVLARLGDPTEARALLRAWEEKSDPRYLRPGYVAGLYAVLGEKEKALSLLEHDSRSGDQSLWIDFRHDWFDSVRNEPRFRALLREINLPD